MREYCPGSSLLPLHSSSCNQSAAIQVCRVTEASSIVSGASNVMYMAGWQIRVLTKCIARSEPRCPGSGKCELQRARSSPLLRWQELELLPVYRVTYQMRLSDDGLPLRGRWLRCFVLGCVVMLVVACLFPSFEHGTISQRIAAGNRAMVRARARAAAEAGWAARARRH